LLGALAGNILVRDLPDAQITRSRRVHVVPGGDAVEHVRFEHGVVAHAGELDAIIRQYMRMIFQVVPELAALRILQNRLESGQHLLAVELLGCARVVVAQGHVGRLAPLEAE
jgi:hypothetical protein